MRLNSSAKLNRSTPTNRPGKALPSPKTIEGVNGCRPQVILGSVLFLFAIQLLAGCYSHHQPSVTFSQIPVAAAGGPDNVAIFEGDMRQAHDEQRLLLYSKAVVWWLQPEVNGPYTAVLPGGHWKREVHLGSDYAAIVADARFTPPATMPALPPLGNGVIAISTTPGAVEGPFHSSQPIHQIRFSGYDWLVRTLPTDRLGPHSYSAENVSLDERGFLHLRITKGTGGWVCSEIKLNRSLGYGAYAFTVEDSSHFEPAAVFSMYTWSDAGLAYNHREMNVNLSRWGHSDGNNAEFIVQPFYVKTNSYRFKLPHGRHTFSFRWEPGSVLFRSVSGAPEEGNQHLVALHAFGGNIPPPSDEAAHMNFCEFGLAEIPLAHEAEIVVERFQYLP